MTEKAEVTALALTEHATAGPWSANRNHIYVVGPDGKRATGMQVGMWPSVGQAYREDDAELIAFMYPGRVKAMAACISAARKLRRLQGRDSSVQELLAAEDALDAALNTLDGVR